MLSARLSWTEWQERLEAGEKPLDGVAGLVEPGRADNGLALGWRDATRRAGGLSALVGDAA
jgi:hypothetical protein